MTRMSFILENMRFCVTIDSFGAFSGKSCASWQNLLIFRKGLKRRTMCFVTKLTLLGPFCRNLHFCDKKDSFGEILCQYPYFCDIIASFWTIFLYKNWLKVTICRFSQSFSFKLPVNLGCRWVFAGIEFLGPGPAWVSKFRLFRQHQRARARFADLVS